MRRSASPLPLLRLAATLASACATAAAAQAPTAPPAGVPPAASKVAAFMKIGSARSPSFSPDGKQIVYVSDASGLPQLWIVPATGGSPRPLTALPDPVGFAEWSPDGTWIAYSVAPGGGMNQQVWLIRPDGTGAKRVTDGGSETNWLGRFRADGKVLAFASNRKYRAHMDAWLLDVPTGVLTMGPESKGSGGYEDLSRDGKTALLLRTPQRGDSDLYLVDLATKKETLLTPHEGPASFSGLLAPDGKSVYVSTNAGREMIAFGRIDVAKGTPGPVEILAARADAELADFVLDEAGTTAALLWNVAGRSELAFYDLKHGHLTPGPALPAERASGLTFSKDGTRLAMAVNGSRHPSDVFVLDLGSRTFTRVTSSRHDGVDLDALIAPSLVKVDAYDGKPFWGWLYVPKGFAKPGPLVLSFHGGPEGQEVPAFNPTYQALLAQGIAVFAPNVRGSAGFGRTFVNADNQEKRLNVLRDVKSCVDWVVGQKLADPKRLGIMGGSYGGWVTMAALTAFPDAFAAGADLFGIVNFFSFFAETEPWMAQISKTEYGDPDTQKELLKNLSPLFKLGWIKAPVLVLHGKNDTNVPVVEATQVVTELKKRNVPVELILFPDEGHGFRKLPNRIRATEAITAWFAKYLKAPAV
jgi:dipeptidyl aminopeptidase/acylaminoacyl peptidase